MMKMKEQVKDKKICVIQIVVVLIKVRLKKIRS